LTSEKRCDRCPQASPIGDNRQQVGESPSPEEVAGISCGGGWGITDAMLAGMLQIGCLQNESMGFVQCYQFESTVGKEVQGKHSVPWPTALCRRRLKVS